MIPKFNANLNLISLRWFNYVDIIYLHNNKVQKIKLTNY
jgi:hypothetical protein